MIPNWNRLPQFTWEICYQYCEEKTVGQIIIWISFPQRDWFCFLRVINIFWLYEDETYFVDCKNNSFLVVNIALKLFFRKIIDYSRYKLGLKLYSRVFQWNFWNSNSALVLLIRSRYPLKDGDILPKRAPNLKSYYWNKGFWGDTTHLMMITDAINEWNKNLVSNNESVKSRVTYSPTRLAIFTAFE